uniref:Uncharacterized protein n=1 Tax=Schistocephalus solidus TaxID=70667 RepID=A0A0X3NI79_SCHSO
MSELSSVTYCQTLSNGGNTASKQKNCSPFKLLSPSSHSSPLGLANSYVKCEPQQLEYMSSGQSNTRDKGAPFNPSACPRSEDSSLHLVDTRRSTVTSDETLQPICICSCSPY